MKDPITSAILSFHHQLLQCFCTLYNLLRANSSPRLPTRHDVHPVSEQRLRVFFFVFFYLISSRFLSFGGEVRWVCACVSFISFSLPLSLPLSRCCCYYREKGAFRLSLESSALKGERKKVQATDRRESRTDTDLSSYLPRAFQILPQHGSDGTLGRKAEENPPPVFFVSESRFKEGLPRAGRIALGKLVYLTRNHSLKSHSRWRIGDQPLEPIPVRKATLRTSFFGTINTHRENPFLAAGSDLHRRNHFTEALPPRESLSGTIC